MDIQWIPFSPGDVFPINTVLGGHDIDGSPTYVGRCYHGDVYLPANVKSNNKMAYFSFNGNEYSKIDYQLLVGENYSWQHCLIAEFSNAISTGKSTSGESCLVGRGQYGKSLVVGRVDPSQRCLYIPFDGKEIKLEEYEILLDAGKPGVNKWGPDKNLPEPTFQVSEARAFMFHRPNYEPDPYAAHSAFPPTIPPPTPPTTTQSQQQPSLPTNYDNWVLTTGIVPPNAVHAGYDIDGSLIYVSRTYHNGDYIPAKAIPRYNTACVPYQGLEIVKTNFEYLVGDKYIWIDYTNTPFPEGAVVANPLTNGESLYVGRCQYNGSLLCGKIERSNNCLKVSFHYQEVEISSNFQILVNKDIYYGNPTVWQ